MLITLKTGGITKKRTCHRWTDDDHVLVEITYNELEPLHEHTTAQTMKAPTTDAIWERVSGALFIKGLTISGPAARRQHQSNTLRRELNDITKQLKAFREQEAKLLVRATEIETLLC